MTDNVTNFGGGLMTKILIISVETLAHKNVSRELQRGKHLQNPSQKCLHLPYPQDLREQPSLLRSPGTLRRSYMAFRRVHLLRTAALTEMAHFLGCQRWHYLKGPCNCVGPIPIRQEPWEIDTLSNKLVQCFMFH